MTPTPTHLSEALSLALCSHQRAVVFLRHARSTGNVERRLAGRMEVPLDALGWLQVQRLRSAWAGPSGPTIYTSPLRRAVETARALGTPRLHPGLEEIALGALEGVLEQELEGSWRAHVLAWRADPVDHRPPAGESLRDCQTRVLLATREILALGPWTPDPLVLVSHQMALATLLCALLDRPLVEFRALMMRNAAFTVLGLSREGAWTMLCFDDASHLDGLEPPRASVASDASTGPGREQRASIVEDGVHGDLIGRNDCGVP
jgi:broad specificity phosphatase PhoE